MYAYVAQLSRPKKVVALVTAVVAGYYLLRKPTRAASGPPALSREPVLKQKSVQSELAKEKQVAAAAAAAGLGAPPVLTNDESIVASAASAGLGATTHTHSPMSAALTNEETLDTLDSVVRESRRHADYATSQLQAVKKGDLKSALGELEAVAEDAEAHAEQVSELIAQDAKVHDDLAKSLTRIPLT